MQRESTFLPIVLGLLSAGVLLCLDSGNLPSGKASQRFPASSSNPVVSDEEFEREKTEETEKQENAFFDARKAKSKEVLNRPVTDADYNNIKRLLGNSRYWMCPEDRGYKDENCAKPESTKIVGAPTRFKAGGRVEVFELTTELDICRVSMPSESYEKRRRSEVDITNANFNTQQERTHSANLEKYTRDLEKHRRQINVCEEQRRRLRDMIRQQERAQASGIQTGMGFGGGMGGAWTEPAETCEEQYPPPPSPEIQSAASHYDAQMLEELNGMKTVECYARAETNRKPKVIPAEKPDDGETGTASSLQELQEELAELHIQAAQATNPEEATKLLDHAREIKNQIREERRERGLKTERQPAEPKPCPNCLSGGSR